MMNNKLEKLSQNDLKNKNVKSTKDEIFRQLDELKKKIELYEKSDECDLEFKIGHLGHISSIIKTELLELFN